ncbi:hypothetical protein [Mammaliicoccus vitulinus]|uniref:hypothetical protein n=1 Tax=Mammaliicoccus vitulinus TaxID=71237 RepID=UPI00248D1354|nr:hypothetical protein [Mammaliicoccus vitulinus]
MIQKFLINVNIDKPLQAYGDGHIIMYDSTKDQYYVTTKEMLLMDQNAKIKELEDQNLQMKNYFNKTLTDLKKQYDDFIEEQQRNYNNFLQKYTTTNKKIIEMVDAVVEKE